MSLQVELYREMSALSLRMVDAARANDWDDLVELERRVAALRERVMRVDSNDALTPMEIEDKRGLIQQILENDAEIRRHTEPWMEQVRQYLGNASRRQRVEQAYGAG